jgi:alpha-L-arabinofuranosidase
VAGVTYEGYVYLRAGARTLVQVGFESAAGDATLASAEFITTSAAWTRYDFALAPVSGDTGGRFVIALPAPGTVDIGYAFVQPEIGARYKGLPVRNDLAEAYVMQRVTFLRFGGSMVNTGAYRWRNMRAPRDQRPYSGGLFYKYGSNGWGIIEFLNLTEAMGVVGVPTVDIDEAADDLVHLLEYANGSTSTAGGALRAEHGHPQPYRLKYLELGNELGNKPKEDAPAFFDKFADLAVKLWAADPDIILVLGDWEYPREITDPNDVESPRIASLAGHKKVLDLAARYGREVWIDCHVFTEDIRPGKHDEERYDAVVLRYVKALDSLYEALHGLSKDASFKLVVFELNAFTHDAHRALANAMAIGAMQALGDRIHMVASANSLQPFEQNDNVWDQGLLFFDTHRIWAQPAWYVTQMKARNYLPRVVEARVQGRQSNTFHVIATRSVVEHTMILHVVNTLDVPRRYRIELTGFEPQTSRAHYTTLAGRRGARNTADDRYAVAPHERLVEYSRVNNVITLEFEAASFTIVRLE